MADRALLSSAKCQSFGSRTVSYSRKMSGSRKNLVTFGLFVGQLISICSLTEKGVSGGRGFDRVRCLTGEGVSSGLSGGSRGRQPPCLKNIIIKSSQ